MVPSAPPDHDTPTTMLDCRQDTLVFVLLTWLPPHYTWHHLNQISLSWSHQTTVPVIHVLSLLVFSKLFAGFLCIIFRRGFLLGRQPCRPICCSMRLMVWALTGWPPTPSTSAAMLASNLCIWRWACALQFLWSTMARPVLSGTCPVKPLYGLGHRAAAEFQGLRNLLIAYARVVRYDNIYRMDEIKSLLFHIMFYRLFRGVAKYIVYGNTFSSFEWLRSLYAAHHGAWRGDRSRWRTTSQGKTRSSFLNEGLHL